MGRKEKFVRALVGYCRDDSHGYSQTNDRFGHPDFDCSGLMYQCGYDAGYDLPRSGTRYTGTILQHFRAAGWSAEPFDGNVWDLEPGDIVLNVGNHVEACVEPGYFGGAHIDEHGNISGGQPGDQTGNEVSICGAYVYSDGWDWVLTPPSDGAEPEPAPSHGIRYCVSTDPEGEVWFDDMVGTTDTGGSNDTWAGELGYPVMFFAVQGKKYRCMTEDSFPEWLPWVDRFDKSDLDKGCAGDGTPMLMIQVEGCSPEVHRKGEWNGVIDGVTIR